MPIPVRTPQQRQAASAKAVAARQRRAEIRADLKTARISVTQTFELVGSDEAIAGMRVRELVESLPRVGPRRADEALNALRIAPTRRLRGLGSAQRAALITRLG